MTGTVAVREGSAGAWNMGGIFGWIRARAQGRERPAPRLAVLERIPLAPRQSLLLIEAEGNKLLVATSPDAGPTFFALGRPERSETLDRSRSC
jgi:flagellar biogenesis protein FliO